MDLPNSEGGLGDAAHCALQEACPDGILLVDPAGMIISCNRRFADMWGLAPALIAGKSAASVFEMLARRVGACEAFLTRIGSFHRQLEEIGRDEILLNDGRILEQYTAPVRLDTGSYVGRAWYFRDITALKRAKDRLRASLQVSEERLRTAGLERERVDEQIRFTARHDILTGLTNRSGFVDALQQAIERAQRDGESFAVLYLDLDHFKDINDTLGHPVGDLLLQSLADRLRTSVRGMDTLARFGGDEFALIQTSIPEPLDAAVLSEKLLAAINAPFTILGNVIRTGASIGIAVYGLDSPSAETLLSHADVALYRAKAEGRGTFRFFTDSMDLEVRTRVSLGADLRGAIAAGQLFLVYQPQIDVDTGRFVGVEALARWQHPKRGLVSPTTFIPIAEQNGMIVALGTWALREACRQMKEWITAAIAPPLIAVNVSGQQFKTPFALENVISAVLAETGLPPQRLELELTESVLMEISRAHNDALLRLRKAGHRIAIDDFGTGYSSLEYLARFPVDRIKIAQNFIVDLTGTSGNPVIVKAAISLAHELNLDVVVEGVETLEQLELVRSWGCREIQGFYYSRPLRADELSVLLRAGKILPRQPLPVAVAEA